MPSDAAIRWFSQTQALVYRLTGGRLWNGDGGHEVILLTTTGRRSGQERTTPLVFVERDGDLVVVGSNAGRGADPGWVHNLRLRSEADVTRGRRRVRCTARFAVGLEADELWARLVAHASGFAAYREQTERPFPIVVLTPRRGEPCSERRNPGVRSQVARSRTLLERSVWATHPRSSSASSAGNPPASIGADIA